MGVVVGNFSKNRINKLSNTIKTRLETDISYKHCIKGDALRINDMFTESIEQYLESIDLNSYNPDAFKGLGSSYRELGMNKSAAEAFEKARKISPFDKNIYYELACCYLQEQKPYLAIKYLIYAINLDNNFVEALQKLAKAHEMLSEYDLSILIYKKIIEVRPSNINTYYSLASLQLKEGMLVDAGKTFKQLLSINPEYTKAHLGLAIAFDKMGETEKATRYYRKYIKLKPNSINSVYVIERTKVINQNKKSDNHLILA